MTTPAISELQRQTRTDLYSGFWNGMHPDQRSEKIIARVAAELVAGSMDSSEAGTATAKLTLGELKGGNLPGAKVLKESYSLDGYNRYFKNTFQKMGKQSKAQDRLEVLVQDHLRDTGRTVELAGVERHQDGKSLTLTFDIGPTAGQASLGADSFERM